MPILREEDLGGSWSVVLLRAADYAGPWMKKVTDLIQEMELPVEMKEEKAASGLLKAITGGSRNVLAINPTSKALNRIRWLLYAFPVGKNVTLGSYLVGEDTGFGKSAGMRIPVIHNMDIFDTVDIMAIDHSIYSACDLAVDAVEKQMGKDFKELKRSVSMYGSKA